MFKDASKDFLAALIQTVRLIRSKGVGVFFVTQSPKDVHEDVLAQLGSRIQHQLRAFTPNDANALRAAVRTYPTSGYDLEELLTTLGIGEAVVTVMSEKGAPTPVAHSLLPAPESSMSPSAQSVLAGIVAASPLQAEYSQRVDPESAYEKLSGKIAAGPGEPLGRSEGGKPESDPTAEIERLEAEIRGSGTPTVPPPAPRQRSSKSAREPEGLIEQILGDKAVNGFLKSAGTAIGREITRGVFGTRRRR